MHFHLADDIHRGGIPGTGREQTVNHLLDICLGALDFLFAIGITG
jgi:hypothetical protein